MNSPGSGGPPPTKHDSAAASDPAGVENVSRAVEDSELGFRALSEAAFEAVAISEAGRILFANAAFEKMFGYDRSEVVGISAIEFAAPESRDIVKSKIIAGSEEPYEATGRRKNGSTFPGLLRGKMIDIGGRRLRVTAISDLTHEKRVEADERRTRATLEETYQNAQFLVGLTHHLSGYSDFCEAVAALPSLIVPTLADWSVVVVKCPVASLRTFAASADPAKQPLTEALCQFTPDPNAPSGLAQVIRSGHSVVANSITDEMLDPQGGEGSPVGSRDPELLRLVRELGMRAFIAVPLVARGNTLGAIGLVSARKERSFSGADLKLAEDLGQRAALALDNARLLVDARDAVRVRDEFLSIASHELRTPITSLQLAVQNISRTMSSGNRPELPPELLRRLVETAERQTRRLDQLVDTVLDVSRLGSTDLLLDRTDVDFGELVREVLARLAEDFIAAGSSLVLDIGEPIVGSWDRSRLDQVITNIVANAIKFGAGRPVEVVASRDGDFALLKVTDHGIGIPTEEQDRVFELFERAVSPKHFGGLGIGLYVARRIVGAHLGTLSIESQPAAGATFTVRLPLKD